MENKNSIVTSCVYLLVADLPHRRIRGGTEAAGRLKTQGPKTRKYA
jgi:hypothetical protein